MPAKIAIVHDALPFYGGAERTLAVILELFPGAPVYTLLHRPAAFIGTPLAGADVRTSWLNRLPGIGRNHYRFFPLFPAAIRSFDLSRYDVVISSHYAVAHWVRTCPGQVHLAYVYTPLRYLWQAAGDFKQSLPVFFRPAAGAARRSLQGIDRRSAARVTGFAAISVWIRKLVKQAYGRHADVIYPPVDLGRFTPGPGLRSGFVTVSRLARHKRLEIVIEAFNRLDLPLEIIGEGPERNRLEALAGPRVKFLGPLADAAVAERLGKAQAFVHMAGEDFGIALVEAQAAGCPVIAFGGGAVPETVLDGQTGLLVPEQNSNALEEAVRRFLVVENGFDAEVLQRNAQHFGAERFKEQFLDFVTGAIR